MSLYVKELAGTLGRVQIAMQPDIAGPSSALTLSGTPAYTIQGAGGGPSLVELYASTAPVWFTVTGGAGMLQFLAAGERITYGFPKGTVITVTDEDGGGSGLPDPPWHYFKPTGTGLGDGSSIDNAQTWNEANLNAAATAMAEVDGTIILVGPLTTKAKDAARASDEFPCLAVSLNVSCTIDGIRHPLNPDTSAWAYPTFAGDRTAWLLPEVKEITDTTGWTIGGDAIHVNATGVTIRHINGRRLGTLVKQPGDHTSDDLTLEDIQLYNVQRGQDQPINVRATATVTFTGNPANGDTITIKGTVVTYVTVVTDPTVQVLIAGTASANAQRLRTLINSNPKLFGCTVTGSSTTLTLSAAISGAAGNGTVSLAKSAANITLSAANVAGGTTISNDNTTIRRITAVGFSKALLRISGESDGMVIEDVYADSGWQNNDSFARLFSAVDKGKNVTISDCVCLNIYEEDGTYYNGDAYNVDDGNENVSITNCSMTDSTDGGADFKGFGHTITDANFSKCKRNFRAWGEVEIIGGTSTDPHNSGTTEQELGNGSAHVYVNGYFATTVDVGSDPYSADGVNASGASRYRGKVRFTGTHFVGDGDVAGDGSIYRQQSLFLLMGGAGGIARFVNCTRNSPLYTGGVTEPLTAANAGPIDQDFGTKAMFFNGDPETIDCQITADLTQDWPEGSWVTVRLTSDVAAARGTLYTACTWEIDAEATDVVDNNVGLSDWAGHRPTVSFVAPAAPDTVTIPVTVTDAAGNLVSGNLVVTSQAVGPTHEPLYAGAGALVATGTVGATSVTPTIPSHKVENDVAILVAHTSMTGVAPTIAGYTLIGSLLQATGQFNSHLYWKRLGAVESNPSVDFGVAITNSNNDIHAAQCFLIRNCRTTGTPFENYVGEVDSTSDTEKVGPTGETEAGNRMMFNLFVLNNDIVNAEVTAPDWVEVMNTYTTLGRDMAVVVARKTQPALSAAVPGCSLAWDMDLPSADRLKTTSQAFTLAFLPKVDP